MVRRRFGKQLKWHAATLLAAFAIATVAPASARAAGLFDFLFGNSDRQQPSSPPSSYADPSLPVAPAALGQQSVRQSNGDTGHVVAYCVRLCDGQHFPLEHMTNATPVETCRAMCPASKTKVYFGSEIGAAVAKDGARYADLDNAFIYRKQLVANCTCNGKDAFGLAPFDLSSDPTLRPGDMVSTKDGIVAYSGKSGSTEAFTQVDQTAIAAQLNPSSAPKLSRRNEPAAEVDDDPGTIAMPQTAPPPVNLGTTARGPAAR